MGERYERKKADPRLVAEDSWLERTAHALLSKVFNFRDIVIDGDLYLRRWYLTPRSWNTRLFLHCIRRPDEQRSLHDQPWDFSVFVLARGYEEVAKDGMRLSWAYAPSGSPVGVASFQLVHSGYDTGRSNHGTFSFRSVRAEHTHAVDPVRGPAWTLVFAKQARRVWGFHTPNGWKDWRTYLGLPQDTPDHAEDA